MIVDGYRHKACNADPVVGLVAAALHLVACEKGEPERREQARLWLAIRAVLPAASTESEGGSADE